MNRNEVFFFVDPVRTGIFRVLRTGGEGVMWAMGLIQPSHIYPYQNRYQSNHILYALSTHNFKKLFAGC